MSFFQSLYQDRGPTQGFHSAGPEMVPQSSPVLSPNRESSITPPILESTTSHQHAPLVEKEIQPSAIQKEEASPPSSSNQEIQRKTLRTHTAEFQKQIVQKIPPTNPSLGNGSISENSPSLQPQSEMSSSKVERQRSLTKEETHHVERVSAVPEVSQPSTQSSKALPQNLKKEAEEIKLSEITKFSQPIEETERLRSKTVISQSPTHLSESSPSDSPPQLLQPTPSIQSLPVSERPSSPRLAMNHQTLPQSSQTQIIKAPEVRIGQIDITIQAPPSSQRTSTQVKAPASSAWFTKTL